MEHEITRGTVENDGVRLAYQQYGRGPDVLMVNNFFMHADMWRSVTATLAESHRVTVYDMRNQGDSTRTGRPVRWEDHLNDLLAVVDGLGLEQPALVGTSTSCLLCRDAAIARPDAIGSIVLTGPALSPWGPDRHRRILESWLTAMDHGGAAALFDLCYPLIFGGRLVEELGRTGYVGRKMGFLAHNDEDELRSNMELSTGIDASPELLREVACPTLVLVGDDDFGIGVAAASGLADILPQGSLRVLPRSGHLPYLDAPDLFQAEIVDFLKGGQISAAAT